MPDLGGTVLAGDFDAKAGPMDSFEGSGGGSLDASLSAELLRGVSLGAQIGAQVNLAGEFNKFINLEVAGSAHASAALEARAQLPLNLFDEAGFIVSVKAAAQAGAAVRLSIGLNVGDFLALVDQIPGMGNIAGKLIRVLLESVEIKGGVFAQAAVSAMAYGNISAGFRLVETNKGGVRRKPGFYVGAEGGVGLKAGAGYRVFAAVELDDPRAFVRRSIDVLVDQVAAGLTTLLSEHPLEARQAVDIARAPVKTALRLAFELGELSAARVAAGTFGSSADDAKQISLRTLQVIVEEGRRFFFDRACRSALVFVQERLAAAGIPASDWDAANSERAAFAARLRAMPAEPFEPSDVNRDYWRDLVTEAADLADALLANDALEEFVEPLAIVWASTQLLFATMERIGDVNATATVLGRNVAQAQPSFTGSPPHPGPDLVREHIAAELGEPVDFVPRHADLVGYLLRPSIVDRLRGSDAVVSQFLRAFDDAIESVPGLDSAVAILLEGEIALADAGTIDARNALRPLVDAIRALIDSQVRDVLTPAIRDAANGDEAAVLYWNEVCVPSLTMATDLVFVKVADWESGDVSEPAFQEALSAVLLTFLGRNMVVFSDVLGHAARTQMKRMFDEAADHVDDSRGLVSKLGAGFGGGAAELAGLIAETLRICGEVLGPLPDGTRRRIRDLLFEVIQPLPLDEPAGLLEKLRDQGFCPDPEKLLDLGLEMAAIATNQLVDFFQRVLARLGELFLEAIADAVRRLAEAVTAWVEGLKDAVDAAIASARQLAADALALLEEARKRVQEEAEAFFALLRKLSSNSARQAFLEDLTGHYYDKAKALLWDIPGYGWLPRSWRRTVKDKLYDVISALLENDLVEGLLEVLETDEDEAQDLYEQVRALRGTNNYTQKLTDIVLDWAEDKVTDALGGEKPEIDIGFRKFGIHFTLGTVKLNVGTVLDVVRSVLETSSAVIDAVGDTADKALAALGGEKAAADKQIEADAAAKEAAQLEHVQGEAVARARMIEILEPADGAFCEAAPDIEIRLTGVPESFLGREAHAQQRIHVFLNAAEIALDSFSATTRAATKETGTRETKNVAGLEVAGPSDARGHGVVRSLAARRAPAPHPLTTPPLDDETTSMAARGLTSAIGSARIRSGRSAARHANARGVVGRTRARDGMRERLHLSTEASLTLRRSLADGELRPGLNSLIVVLADGHGEALRVSSSFMVPPPEPAARPARGGKRGERPKLAPSRLEDIVAMVPSRDRIKEAGRELRARFKPKARRFPRAPKKAAQRRVWSGTPPYGLVPLEVGTVCRGRVLSVLEGPARVAIGPNIDGTVRAKASRKLPAAHLRPLATVWVRVDAISKSRAIRLSFVDAPPVAKPPVRQRISRSFEIPRGLGDGRRTNHP